MIPADRPLGSVWQVGGGESGRLLPRWTVLRVGRELHQPASIAMHEGADSLHRWRSVHEWIAKTYAEAGTGAIVTTGEAWRRLIVPVAVEGEVPVQLSPELDVVRSVQSKLQSSRLRKGR